MYLLGKAGAGNSLFRAKTVKFFKKKYSCTPATKN